MNLLGLVLLPGRQGFSLPYRLIRVNWLLIEKYKLSITITEDGINEDKYLDDLKSQLYDKLKEIKKDVQQINNKITHEFFQKRVDEIKVSRCDNPGKFFARAQPDSVFRNQQLWTVEYNEHKTLLSGEVKEIKVNSSIPTIVSAEVRKAWETIFSTKKKLQSEFHDVFG